MQQVIFFGNSICKNSFGPGPKIPVIINCDVGNNSFNVPINGIEPPTPLNNAVLPLNYIFDASCNPATSHALNLD